MNVYTRPLFRQAGGPAQPMAQDMSQEIERVAGQLNYLNTMIAVEPNMSTKRQLMEAIQNLAQTTPPEVFNAASKLVRDAEASRSPDVMANPNMDPGNRSFVSPVNRANGGEIMPPAMQQGMAPPPEAAMLERAEMMASQQAEQLGAQYAQDMMQNVNSAESAEDLINAMRGNQMPLEARREELGGLVGMEDANATPESVLALVQPVIMMTEEGAINSGIGELMQGIIGDVEMTTEGGMPTEMGQGVGGLMMAGAQEAPAPQNFNQGGAVQKFSNGGIAEVRTFYDELLPLYKDVLGQEQEDVNMAKAGGLFDITELGLALASGVDPRTGKSMANQPFAAQLAAAASPLPEKLRARAADIRKQERAIKAAALEGAVRRGSEAEQYRQAERIALIKQRPLPFKSEMKVVEMPDGRPRSFNVDTKQGAKDFSEAIAGGAREVVTPTTATTEYLYKEGEPPVAVPASDRTEINKLLGEGYSPKAPEAYGGSLGAARERLNQPETLDLLRKGLLEGERSPEVYQAMSDLTSVYMTIDPITGVKETPPVFLEQFVQLAADPELRQQNIEETVRRREEASTIAQPIYNQLSDPTKPIVSKPVLMPYIDERISRMSDVDLRAATGLQSGVASTVEYLAQQVGDLFGYEVSGQTISDSDEARRVLENIKLDLSMFIQSAPGDDRPLAREYEVFLENYPSGNMWESDASVKSQFKNMLDLVKKDINLYNEVVQGRQSIKGTAVSDARVRVLKGKSVLKLLESIVSNLDKGPSGSKITPASEVDMSQFYRSNRG